MSEYIKNQETGKIELHFDKEDYMKLSEEEKRLVKSKFLFSKYSKIWISRGKFPSYSYSLAEEVAKKIGLSDGGKIGEKLSFKEQMDIKQKKAEKRADKYDYKADKAQKIGNGYQKPINDMHGDIAFFTQPNINSSSGRAFTNRRNKMWSMYEKGFEEFKKSEYYKRKAEASRRTANMTKPKDKAFCERRIKEAESSIKKLKNNIETYEEYRKQMEQGNTNITNKYGWKIDITEESIDRNIERWNEILEMEMSKYIYYHECLEDLGGIAYSKNNIDVGDIVLINRYNRKYKVKVISTGTKNFKYIDFEGRTSFYLQASYAEVLEIIKKVDKEKSLHPFKVGEEYILSETIYEPEYKKIDKKYKIIKVSQDKVTVKCGNERAISKKVISRFDNDEVSFYFYINKNNTNGLIEKRLKREEATNYML